MLKRRNVYLIISGGFLIILLIILSQHDKTQTFNVVLISSEQNSVDIIYNETSLFGLDFQYLLNSRECDETVYATFIVTSYFSNVETRSAMRRAYSNGKLKELNLRRVFLLGTASGDKFLSQNAIADESRRFGDIVQGNFQESYKNLTYKHVMGHRWISEYCNSTKYVIKMDDDIVIYIRKMLPLLHNLTISTDKFMAGLILKNMKPIREPVNKWYVSPQEFEESFYPVFLSGWFYVTTPKVSRGIFDLSHSLRYFWIDDVYVTGQLALVLGVKHHDLSRYFTTEAKYLFCCLKNLEIYDIDCDYIIGPNGGDNVLFFKFNRAMEKCSQIKCKNSAVTSNNCSIEQTFYASKGQALIESTKL